jgi:hypothetical protein
MSADDLLNASRYDAEAKRVSRKGIKQKRWLDMDKLKVCRYLKENKNANRETVGLSVLNTNVPKTTVDTWWSNFPNLGSTKDIGMDPLRN